MILFCYKWALNDTAKITKYERMLKYLLLANQKAHGNSLKATTCMREQSRVYRLNVGRTCEIIHGREGSGLLIPS